MQHSSPKGSKPGSNRQNCQTEPGKFRPIVNHAACEGKAACRAVCPYNVFEIRRIESDHFRALPILAKAKIAVHGFKTAYTPRADACRACGLCVTACPEQAIELVAWANLAEQNFVDGA
jgi:NAD-dependent dihydropyrimidine dehydrogenase PreA subunit